MQEPPHREVSEKGAELDGIEDEDARDNYRVVLRFRQRLLKAGTVEGAYLDLFKSGNVDIPPLFIEQMVHVILRNILDGETAPRCVFARRSFSFATRNSTLQESTILLADLETVEMHAAG